MREPEINPDADVVVKSELHFSSGDVQQELKLIRSGDFDAVVFEGSRKRIEGGSKPTLSDRVVGFVFFFLSPLYTDLVPTIIAALREGAQPYFTRERDGEVIDQLPFPLPSIVMGLWFGLLTITAFFGAPEGGFRVSGIDVNYKYVSAFAFLGMFSIPILVRILRGKWTGEINRNQIMANKIESAVAESGRTLAIVGGNHGSQIESRLDSNLVVDSTPIRYGYLSWPGLKELVPGFVLTFGLFMAVWTVVEWVGGAIILILLMILT